MPTVADAMQPDPVTVGEDTSVEEVYGLLRDNDLPGLPVVNAGGRCVGIITENDLVIGDEEGDLHIPRYVELFGGLVFLPELHHLNPFKGLEERLKKATAATAKDLMTSDPVAAEPGWDVQRAAHVIAEEGHNRLPVVEHGRLVGVVTRVDVLRALTAA